jgi:uncharacterized YigZ family protein
MLYIKEVFEQIIEINKSKFIGLIFPLNNAYTIDDALKASRALYPKANHYCYATIMGDDGEHHTMNDDGEPQRTAGLPILEVLKHHRVTDIACIVIRYFGGIKLGAGGLVRAYTKTTTEVLARAILYKKMIAPVFEISFAYSFIDFFEHQLKDLATIVNKSFLEHVTFEIVFDKGSANYLDTIKHQLIDIKEKEPKTLYIKA